MIQAKQLPFTYILMCFSFFSFSQNSFDKQIKGEVAGLNIYSQSSFPGTPSQISIRGQGSFFGNNSPLIVLDDIPYENFPVGANGRFPGLDMLSFINPNDIESIKVLKNAKDTSPYGFRGSNGVILIYTKKGQSREKKFKILD